MNNISDKLYQYSLSMLNKNYTDATIEQLIQIAQQRQPKIDFNINEDIKISKDVFNRLEKAFESEAPRP